MNTAKQIILPVDKTLIMFDVSGAGFNANCKITVQIKIKTRTLSVENVFSDGNGDWRASVAYPEDTPTNKWLNVEVRAYEKGLSKNPARASGIYRFLPLL